MVRLQLLGSACLRDGAAVLTGPPAQRHRIALLAILAAAWPMPVPRARLLALLWPEKDEAAARRLLNLAVHVLRNALGKAAIVSVGDALLLGTEALTCDVLDLRAAVAHDDLDRVAQLHAAPLLEGFSLPEATDFGHWLDDTRRELQRVHRRAVLAQLERCERTGDLPGAVAACRQLVALDPYSVDDTRRLMRALEQAGDRASAIRQAVEHAARRRVDLDLGPDPAVAALADELREGVLAAVEPPSVAILPLRVVGDELEAHTLGDGITEEVIALLAKRRDLRVIARGAVSALRARDASPREVGRVLSVRYVLDGSLRVVLGRVRVVATLIDAETERPVWAETYERAHDDVLALQSDVALRLGEAVHAEVVEGTQATGDVPAPDSLAFRLVLQGRQQLLGANPSAAIARARDAFARAVSHAPGFLEGQVQRALACVELAAEGDAAFAALYAEARDAVDRALAIDARHPDALAADAFVRMVAAYDWRGADAALQRALERGQESALVQGMLARLFWARGRYDDALPHARRAQALGGTPHGVDLVTLLLSANRYGEALAEARVLSEVDAYGPRTQALLGWALFLNRQYEAGVRAMEEAIIRSDGHLRWRGEVVQMYGMMGRWADARAAIAELEALPHISPCFRVHPHQGIGEADAALALLEQAVAGQCGPAYAIPGSFIYAPLRGHPRFQTLVRGMGS
ncbi:MAG TPA: BTAD domain-containing putative transcriptional regulator [Gemmatimonadales bacterium]|nr:BTAD domain-containing putative transcriptional regulator [Gemmatimonadales bacterium]